MELGAPRISVTELTDLHRLLMDRGFRRSSLDDFRVVQEEHNAEVVRPESDNIGRLAPFSAPVEDRVCPKPASGNDSSRARKGGRGSLQPLDASGRKDLPITAASLSGAEARREVCWWRQGRRRQDHPDR